MSEIQLVDKRGERVRSMFAGIARRYDLLNHVLSLNIDRSWRRRTVQLAPPTPGLPILDVCTGTGDLALDYFQACKGQCEITATDFCAPMLEIARPKAKKVGASITFLEADTLQLPFESDRFDIVSVAFGLRNVSDTRGGVREMTRVARPGGRVVILEFSRPRLPILRSLYLAYFKYLLPRIGQSVSKSEHGAYSYLPASVMEFPDGQQMVQLLTEEGLCDVTMHPMTFGIVTLYIGYKPADRCS